MTTTIGPACRIGLLALALSALASCGGEADPTACSPRAASDFPCADATQCLSVTATWCYPGAKTCANTNVDLTLTLPDSAVVTATSGTNGCVHDGDEQANALTGPFDENITCSPFTHPSPPDRIDSGTYVAKVSEFALLGTEFVRLDIDVNGQTSCKVLQLSAAGQAQFSVTYP